jgi:hypothetical protein
VIRQRLHHREFEAVSLVEPYRVVGCKLTTTRSPANGLCYRTPGVQTER